MNFFNLSTNLNKIIYLPSQITFRTEEILSLVQFNFHLPTCDESFQRRILCLVINVSPISAGEEEPLCARVFVIFLNRSLSVINVVAIQSSSRSYVKVCWSLSFEGYKFTSLLVLLGIQQVAARNLSAFFCSSENRFFHESGIYISDGSQCACNCWKVSSVCRGHAGHILRHLQHVWSAE